MYVEGIEINTFSQKYLCSIGFYKGNDNTLFGDKPAEEYHEVCILIGKFKDSKIEKI